MSNEAILNVFVDLIDSETPELSLDQIAKGLGMKRVSVNLRRKVNEMVKKGLLDINDDAYTMTDAGVALVLEGEDSSNDVSTPDTGEDADLSSDFGDDTAPEPEPEPEPVKVEAEIVEAEIVEAEVIEDEPEYSAEPCEYPMIARSMWESEGLSLSGITETDIEVRKTSIREAAQVAKTMNDRLGLVQGELLYEIKAGEYWQEWEFDSFESYVESELGYKARKAKYMIDIYAKFVLELGLPMERLKALEWSKAKEVLTIIDKDNSDEVLGVLEGSTFNEVRKYARKKRGKGDGDDGFKRINFSLTDDQAEMVELALASACKVIESDNRSRALVALAEEYVSTYGSGE